MSIFDNEETLSDLSERECIGHTLTNIPDEYKPIYSLIWYDIFNKYLVNDNISFTQKVRIYYAFTKYPERWKIDIYSHLAIATTKPLPIIQIFSNEYCTDISNEKSYINVLFRGMFEASESAKRYNEILDFYGGDTMNYWKMILENICNMFIHTRLSYTSNRSMLEFDLEDISKFISRDLGYYILDKDDNVICVENPLEVCNRYLMCVYKVLDECGVEINKEYS